MKKIQLIVQEIFILLQERIIDSQKQWGNIISEVNKREVKRYQDLIKLLRQMKQHFQGIDSKVIKQLYKGSKKIFQRMKGEFVGDTNYQYDYEMLIGLYKKYFVEKKDIRIVMRIEQMGKGRINQKVITVLLKMLIEETNNYISEKIQRFSKLMNNHEILHQREAYKKEQVIIRNNNKNVLYPIFGQGRYKTFNTLNLRNSYATVINSTPVQKNRHLLLSFQKKHKKTISDTMNIFFQTKQKPIQKIPFIIKNLIIKNKQNDIQYKTPQTSDITKRKIVLRTKTNPQINYPKTILFNQSRRQIQQPFTSYYSFMQTFNILDIDQTFTFSLFTRVKQFKFLLQQSLNRNKDIHKSIFSNVQIK